MKKKESRVDASRNLQVLHALVVCTSANNGSAAVALCVFRRQQQHFDHQTAANTKAISTQPQVQHDLPLESIPFSYNRTRAVSLNSYTMASEKSDTHKQEGGNPVIPRVSLRAQLTYLQPRSSLRIWCVFRSAFVDHFLTMCFRARRCKMKPLKSASTTDSRPPTETLTGCSTAGNGAVYHRKGAPETSQLVPAREHWKRVLTMCFIGHCSVYQERG